jgi:hypothetical protein
MVIWLEICCDQGCPQNASSIDWPISRQSGATTGYSSCNPEKRRQQSFIPGQLDTDTLPPYEVLDPILTAYIEEDKSVKEILALGFDEALVRRVIWLVDQNEYKRRQAPPGVKITPRAFGRDRRLPIANRFTG